MPEGAHVRVDGYADPPEAVEGTLLLTIPAGPLLHGHLLSATLMKTKAQQFTPA